MSITTASNGLGHPTRYAIAAVVVAMVGAICLSVYRYGRTAQSSLDRQIARQIEEENIAFCSRFEEDAIVACLSQLTDIRLRHEKRLQARYQGLL